MYLGNIMSRFSPFKSSWLRRRFKSPAESRCRLGVESLEDRVVLTYGPVFTDLLVNNGVTAGDQTNSSISVNASGASIIAWQDTDGSGQGIFAQRYDAAGAVTGSSFRVNTTTAGDQINPQVGIASTGEFVVVWQSSGQDGSGQGIYAQRYQADGTKNGSEFRVNTTTTGDQKNPAIGMESSAFVIAWESDGQDGSGLGIFAQRYNLTAANGSEFQVNSFTNGAQRNPTVGTSLTSGFMIAYEDAGIKGDGSSAVYARLFGSSGTPQGPSFQVSTSTANQQTNPAIGSSGGRFAVTWQSDSREAGNNDLYFQQYLSDGSKAGGETPINSTLLDSQSNPTADYDSLGNLYVAWQSNQQDGDGQGIYIRRFNASGVATTPEVLVNTFTANSQTNPSLAVDTNGRGWVSYSSINQVSPTSGSDIFRAFVLENSPPIASAGGPYSIAQGVTSLRFDASASSDPDPGTTLTYSWDLNGDGVFGDSTVVKPNLTWAQLSALGLSTPGTRNVSVRVSDYLALATTTATTTLTITPNTPPVAVINNAPFSLAWGLSLNLNASGSSDADAGQTLTYSWDVNDDGVFGDSTGVSMQLSRGQLAALGIGATVPQTWNARVRVTDSFGASTISAPVAYTIIPNQPPTANAGGPYSVVQGLSFTLAATGSSDPDNGGSSLNYSWDINGDGVYGDATGFSPFISWAKLTSLGIGGTAPDVRSVRVRVTDVISNVTISDPVTLTILPDHAPTATANGPYSVTPGNSISLNATGSADPDVGDSLNYSWDLNGDGVFGDASEVQKSVSWASLNALGIGPTPGVFNVSVRATDQFGLTNISPVTTLTVLPNNNPIVSLGGPYAIRQGQSLTVDVTSSDPDPGQTVSYSWDINGDGVYGDSTTNSRSFPWSTLTSFGLGDPGTRNFGVIVSDHFGGSVTAVTTLAVTLDHAPVANGGGPYTTVQGVGINLVGTGSSDPDSGDTLTYSWDINGDGTFGDSTSSNVSLAWSNLLSYGIGPSPTTRNVALKVTDLFGLTSTSTATVTITANNPPTAGIGGPFVVTQGSSLTLAATGSTDPDEGQSLSYSWDVNGDGVFGDASGSNPTLTWTTLLSLGINSAPDVRNVTVKVTDTFGAVATSQSTTLTVNANTPPVAIAGGPYSITRGSTLTVSALASYDVNADQTLTYSWDVNGDGSYGDATAAYVTIPWSTLSTLGLGAGATTRNVRVRVTDTYGATTTSSPVVLSLLADNAPTASAGAPYSLFAGSSLVLNAYGSSDPDINQALTYSWDVNGDGVFGDATGATPTLSWTTLTTLGFSGINESRNVRVQVMDPYGAAATSAAVTLDVTNTPPVAKIAAGYVISGQSTKLSASGSGDADYSQSITVTWDINGDGVYGDATGSAPTVNWSQLTGLGISATPGSVYSMRAKVTDNFGVTTTSDPMLLTVGLNRSPVASAGGPYTILSGKQVSFDASGSSDPDSLQTLTYSWDINGDGLFGDTTGVSKTLTWTDLNALGIISAPDLRNVRVQVTDSLGASTISDPTTLTINPNLTPIANAGGSYTIVQGASLQLNGSDSYDPDGSSVSTSWDLNGDGTFGDVTGATPLVTWATLMSLGIGPAPGTRTISLLAGGTTIGTATLTILPNTAPTILSTGGPYTIDQFAGAVDLHVSAVDSDSQTLTYSWDFGSGSFGYATDNISDIRLTNLMFSLMGVSTTVPLSSPITKYIRAQVTDSFGASTISDPIAITVVPNTAPTANAGGPYAFRQGANLVLDASGSFDPDTTSAGQTLSYTWDVNGDGVFTDAAGVHPTQLSSLKFNAAPGTYYVRVKVSDGKVSTISDPTTLTILPDTAPVASAGGPYSIQQGRSLALNASASTDPDAGDKLTYSWDINGDGIYDDATGATPVLNWKSLTSLGLGSPGSYSVRVRVEDNYGLQSTAATATVTITAGTIPATANPQVLGTFTADEIVGRTDRFVFFTATDPINGDGLWRTDGSVAGTIRLSSLIPYVNANTATVGDYFYYSALSSTYGYELWRSDGTVAGTGLVKDIWAGKASSSPDSLVAMNGKLYFTATDAVHGEELWTSDGTAAGTVIVKDFDPGPDGSNPSNLVAIGNTLYLDANGYVWKSNGTASGTSLLVTPTMMTLNDIYAGSTSSSLYVAGDRLYYARGFSPSEVILGVYNGAAGASNLVLDGSGDTLGLLSVPYFDGKALFQTSYTMTGNTTTSYFYVDADNRVNAFSTDPSNSLAVANGVLYASSTNKFVSIFDGRSNPVIASQNALYMTSSGGSLYFVSTQNTAQQSIKGGYRLWMSDGTPTGTYTVGDLSSGLVPSSATDLTAYNDGLIFIANGSGGISRLYSYFDTITLAPIADSTINEGSTLSFNAAASGTSATYSLGIGAPAGASIDPSTGLFSWTPTDNYPDPVNITIIATDSNGLTDSKTFAVTVNNVAPTLSWSGPSSGLRGEILSFTLSPTDPSTADQAGTFTYNIDWNGDGLDDQTVTGPAGKVVTHTFATAGDITVKIKAIDKDGGTSASVAHAVHIDSWRLQPNPSNSSLTDLLWSGTAGKDSASFEVSGLNQITVHTTLLNGIVTSTTEVFNGVTGGIIVYGQQGADLLDGSIVAGHSLELRGNGGNDTILGSGSADLIYGDSDGGEGGSDSIVAGNGDDVVYADGSEGGADTVSGGIGDDQIFGDPIQGAEGSNDVIDGGDDNDLIDTGFGNDIVTGGSGNDVLIGGNNTDSLTGGAGEDLIIAAGLATSFYATGGIGLQQLWSQWRTSDPVNTRISYLTGTPGGIISPAFVLSPGSTLLDDGAIDTVIADDDTDEDWIIANLPQDVIHQTIDDVFTDL